jgi:hypothetical protein
VAGVQSTTLALMAVRGELPGSDRPLAAVFADTGFEPKRVYEHLRSFIATLGADLPVHVVRGMGPDGTPAYIREDTEAIVRGETNRLADPPVFVKESMEYTPYPNAQQANFVAYLVRRGEIPRFVTMPLFARASLEPSPRCCAASALATTSSSPFTATADHWSVGSGPEAFDPAVLRNVDRHLRRGERQALQALPRGLGSATAIRFASWE